MKRIALCALLAMLAATSWAQSGLKEFQDGFVAFAGQVAPTLSYNATVGGA